MESWGKWLNTAYKLALKEGRTPTQAPPNEVVEGLHPPSEAEMQTQANGLPHTQVTTQTNLKKHEQGPIAAARQQNLQKASTVVLQGIAAPLPDSSATILTGPPDGAAIWVPKSRLTQDQLILPPVKRRKVSAPISPQQKTNSQSPPGLPTTISATPKVQDVPDVQIKEFHPEVVQPADAEVFRCPHQTCEFPTKEFSQKEMLKKHMDEHKPKDPLGHVLGAVRSGLGLDKEKEGERVAGTSTSDSGKDPEQPQTKSSSTPLLSGVTPGKMGGSQTPVPTPNRKSCTSTGDPRVGVVTPANDQLPTPPSHSLWENSLTTNVRQCFSGLEQFAGLTAPKAAHSVVLDLNTTDFEKLTPAYTPGESLDGDNVISPPGEPGSDEGSIGAGLLEGWNPFGEKFGFTAGMFEDVDWERESQRQMDLGGEIENVFNVSLFELKC